MTPTWVHICSTSASRWLETSTVVPSAASDPIRAAHLAGALRVEPVGRLVEDQQVPRRQQGARRCASRCRMPERVGAVALVGRGEQPDPVERGVDPGAGGAPGRPSGRPRRAGPGCRRPDRYGWKAGPSTSAPTRGQHGCRAGRASRAPSSRTLAGGRRDQAEQHPDGRGLARPVGAEEAVDAARWAPPGRSRRPRSAGPNRLVRPAVATAGLAGSITRSASPPGRPRPRTAGPDATAPTSDPAVVGEQGARTACPSAGVPLPQAPLTAGSACEDAAAAVGVAGRVAGIRATTTLVQPLPDHRRSVGAGPRSPAVRARRVSESPCLTTLAPGGGLKANSAGVGSGEVDLGEADLERRAARAAGEDLHPQRHVGRRVDRDPDRADQRAAGRAGSGPARTRSGRRPLAVFCVVTSVLGLDRGEGQIGQPAAA